MKRVYKYLFVFLGSLFMFPLVSNAECSYERQAELSKIASNVGFSYTYNVDEWYNVSMYITTTNITNDIYVENEYNEILKAPESTQKYIGTKTYKFDIYSNDHDCKNEKIMTRYITLPSYNRFANYKECQEHPDFEYCGLWVNTSLLNKSDFDESFSEYLTVENDNADADDEKNILNELLGLLNQYYYIFIAIFILIIAIITNRKIKK